MRQIVGLMMAVLLLAACGGGRRMSPEELQHKLDSVVRKVHMMTAGRPLNRY